MGDGDTWNRMVRHQAYCIQLMYLSFQTLSARRNMETISQMRCSAQEISRTGVSILAREIAEDPLFLTMQELRWLELFPLGLAVLMLTSLECMQGFLLF